VLIKWRFNNACVHMSVFDTATTVGAMHDRCLAMYVLATCSSVPARTAASTAIGLTVAKSSHMFSALGFALLLAAKIYLHSRDFV
jgi:hypothetical protein